MPRASFTIGGQLVDIHRRRVFGASIDVVEGRIARIRPDPDAPSIFIAPGFIDAHVHVESSMLPPAEFARLAVRHGTVATVSDPHEIANVLGVEGVEYMLADAARSPFKFCFGAPACVPATPFETAGATINAEAVAGLLALPQIGYLSEVMDFPGVLKGDPDLLAKIDAARRQHKPADGHAPDLRGEDLLRYASAGISTDHECFELDEALGKIAAGMSILIREGSAAKNYEALKTLLKSHPQHCMLCTDDAHPDALDRGHINRLVARALGDGANLFDLLRVASLHPVQHYNLDVGLLRAGDPADFVVLRDLESFDVIETYLAGKCVARDGEPLLPFQSPETPNRFRSSLISETDLHIRCDGHPVLANIIGARNGQLFTHRLRETLRPHGRLLGGDTPRDILKIAVLSRYSEKPPAVALVRGFGLREGAIASSVAHDSHNIVAVGATDAELARAINLLVESRGGVCAVRGEESRLLSLPIAGLMAAGTGGETAREYEEVDRFAKSLGSSLDSPLMTLSFMALLVIPDLKLSDHGLFSGADFAFAPLLNG